jgi:hypothetical protein
MGPSGTPGPALSRIAAEPVSSQDMPGLAAAGVPRTPAARRDLNMKNIAFPALATIVLIVINAGAAASPLHGGARPDASLRDRHLHLAQTRPAPQPYGNYDLTGRERRRLDGADLQSCMDACQSDGQCAAFSYDTWSGSCSLKDSAGSFRFDPRTVSGFIDPAETPSVADSATVMECFAGRNFSDAAGAPDTDVSFEQCEISCETDKECVAFSYRPADRTCSRFNLAGRPAPDADATVGIKRQLTGPDDRIAERDCSSSKRAAVQRSRRMEEKNLIAAHQRCVLETFTRNAKDARQFDPELLDKAVSGCEHILEPLKKTVQERTGDPEFAESMLQKVRSASKRGVSVALAGYLVDR